MSPLTAFVFPVFNRPILKCLESPNEGGMGSFPKECSKNAESRSVSLRRAFNPGHSPSATAPYRQWPFAPETQHFRVRGCHGGIYSLRSLAPLPQNHRDQHNIHRKLSRGDDCVHGQQVLNPMSPPGVHYPSGPTKKFGHHRRSFAVAPRLRPRYPPRIPGVFPVN